MRHCKIGVLAFFINLLVTSAAYAACPTFHAITNGSAADANQVMDNFDYILTCPNFTNTVGIGTPTPPYPLSINLASSPSTATDPTQIDLGATYGTGTIGNNLKLKLFDVSGFSPSVVYGLGVSNALFELTAGAGADFAFFSNATTPVELMRIRSSGSIGIGQASAPATATDPIKLNLGATYGTGAIGKNLKLKLFDVTGYSPTVAYGLGISNALFELTAGTGGDFAFFSNATTPVELVRIKSGGNVGIGTATPAQALEVNGQIKVDSLASASSTTLCISANVISSCSSSLRYKENVRDAGFGLKEIQAMRPVTFKWKGRKENDFGLVAEDVAKINPLFVTYVNGRIEGVKYAQLTTIMVNAIKQLKAANDRQAAEIKRLSAKVAILERKANAQ